MICIGVFMLLVSLYGALPRSTMKIDTYILLNCLLGMLVNATQTIPYFGTTTSISVMLNYSYSMTQGSNFGLKCMKYMLLVSNLMFMVIGILMIYMGDMVVSIYDDFKIFIKPQYFSPAFFMVCIGAFVLLVSLYGCIGAILHSTMMINTYIFLMCVLVILEIATAVTAFTKRYDIDTFINNSMYRSMNFYKTDAQFTNSWNFIQNKFLCCGVHDINDWSMYNITETTIVFGTNAFGIPKSCCAVPDCTAIVITGCRNYISSVISESGFVLEFFAVCVAITQFLGIGFGHILAKTIKQAESKNKIIRQQITYDKLILYK
ncbi:hypothetical protein RN001_012907 [Aquatica leii]|uniref:Tetraspanin n=1 Tax=Aquatica leii TaxID=1421715 RepID=A0AAN7Q230_9COLE|nr:hypothetical protein RN001_012907 [Aquatica leii]